jgi:hypothetical protein
MLTIDHIHGGGNQHRKQITASRASETFYRWLKNNNYPDGYRTFCYNCNIGAYHNNGVCPHQDDTDYPTKNASTSFTKSS